MFSKIGNENQNHTQTKKLPSDIEKTQKVNLLAQANEIARSQEGEIVQVSVGYGDSRRRIQVANTDGLFASDDQVRTSFSVSCVAAGDTGLQTGRESVGHTVGFELFDQVDVEEIARKASQRAITNGAVPTPSGEMTVVVVCVRWSSFP